MFGRIREAIFGGSKPAAAPRSPARKSTPDRGPRSSFDAAKTTADNAGHWLGADGNGPNASLSPDVRAKLRYRSRYERDNNCYLGGLIEGRAAETIGTGPRLQLTLPESWTDPDFNTTLNADPQRKPNPAREIELKWADHCDAIGLTDILTLADETETTDGEVFLVAFANPAISPDGTAPMLDVKLYESDQCANPDARWGDPLQQDGIEFDSYGNPIGYYFLQSHPGESMWNMDYTAERIDAGRVFHFFKRRRPAAAHGIPGTTPALPLGSKMRRFTDATLSAAEVQALIAAVLTNENTMGPTDGAESPSVEAMDTVNFARAQLLTLYAGQDVKTITPAQPGPSYREFKGEVLTECGRAIGAPRNVSTGSSAEYNYSSGRLDQQGYHRSIKIRRDRIRRIILDRLFRLWLEEAALIPGYLPADLPPTNLWRWTWRWDGFASIDPLKDANAAKVRKESGLTTMERECGETGDDWEEVIEQQARERKKCLELGLPDPYATKAAAPAAAPASDPAADPVSEEAANAA
ncbi:MAG: phage portal protein [Gemmataceae bacterium]